MIEFKYKLYYNHTIYSAQTRREINQYLKDNSIKDNYCITCDGEITIDKRINPFKK